VSISDIKDVWALAALFEVDSNYGGWSEEVRAKDSSLSFGGREIPYFDSTKTLPIWISRRHTQSAEFANVPVTLQ